MQTVLKDISARIEHPIGVIKPSTLKAQHVMRIKSYQIEQYEARGRIVRTVQELGVGHFIVAFQQTLQSSLVQCANGFYEIPVDLWIVDVQSLTRVIADNPRKHWVLG